MKYNVKQTGIFHLILVGFPHPASLIFSVKSIRQEGGMVYRGKFTSRKTKSVKFDKSDLL